MEEFRPLKLDKFKEAWKDKGTGNEKESDEWDRESTIDSFTVAGIDQPLYSSSGSVPYFLDDVEKVKLSGDESFSDLEGEEWKEDALLQQFISQWQNQINEKIHEAQKPFQITFSYSVEEKLKKLGVLKNTGSFMKYFYIPEKYVEQIAEYNEKMHQKKSEKAEEELADIVKNIHLN